MVETPAPRDMELDTREPTGWERRPSARLRRERSHNRMGARKEITRENTGGGGPSAVSDLPPYLGSTM